MQYRPEIEGLRAVAVVAVVLFHAGVNGLSGGFVGVDVFFVISGYLITAILIKDLAEGSFSLMAFYERRARRILPALFVMIACSIPLAYGLMTPKQLAGFGKTTLAVLGFVSNIAFWRDHGYFSAAAELNPLLHTWSLAVEEQFYLIFPLLLLLLWRGLGLRRKALLWVFAGLGLASLGLAEWGWRYEPKASFYLTPTRAWELLAGVVCALPRWRAERNPLILKNTLSLLGIGLIAAAIVWFDAETPNPSLFVALPVLGAMLTVLFAQPGTWVARGLSLRPLVGIGAISYGSYLWHQPLFAFARLRSLGEPPLWGMLALSGLAFGLGALSWRYVEMPFRRKQAPLLPRRFWLFAGLLAVAVSLALAAWGLKVSKGLPKRSNGTVEFGTLEARIMMDPLRWKDCDFNRLAQDSCRTSQTPEVLLWGDSYAQHLAAGLVVSEPDVKLQLVTLPACAPILGLSYFTTSRARARGEECIAFNQNVLRFLEQSPQIQTVILSGSFTGPLRGELVFDPASGLSGGPQAEILAKGLRRTVEQLRAMGRKVVVISPPPTHRRNTGNCLLRREWYNAAAEACDFPLSEAANADALALIQSIEPFVPVIRLDQMICPAGHCAAQQQGRFIWRDAGHLAVEGAQYLGMTHDWMKKLRALAE